MSLGFAYWRVGDRPAAEMEFLRLIDGPLAAQAYRNLGVLNSQAGQPDRAIEYLRRAVSLQNVYPEAHQDLGVAYLQKQMTDDAIEQFRTTLAQQPDHGAAALNLAVAYQNKGDLQSARQTLEKYIQQYGNTNSPYITQARVRLGSLK
jgi:tetratricopeptide (TPR) repeat protein